MPVSNILDFYFGCDYDSRQALVLVGSTAGHAEQRYHGGVERKRCARDVESQGRDGGDWVNGEANAWS